MAIEAQAGASTQYPPDGKLIGDWKQGEITDILAARTPGRASGERKEKEPFRKLLNLTNRLRFYNTITPQPLLGHLQCW